MDVSGIDLFCGVGGLTYGLKTAGIPVVAGIDVDPDCKYPYEANNGAKFIQADVADLESDQVSDLFLEDSCRVLAGCAPCQPFSNLNNGEESSEMEEWGLLKEFGRLVRDIQPEIVVMENVPEIRNHRVYSDFIDILFKNGYQIDIQKVDCQQYGVPQSRQRLVVFGSQLGPITFKDPTHTSHDEYVTVRDTIGGDTLNPIDAGEADDKDPLHRSQYLEDINQKRIQQSVPGGTWRDWDEDLILDCHKKESGSSYDSVYGRMEWNKPAPTITTQFYGYGSGRFGHPEQDRAISLREGAMLQTFPKDYSFVHPEDNDIHLNQIGRFIGNAVPVRLAEAIGDTLKNHFTTNDVRDESPTRQDQGNAISNVSQPQRTESSGTESVQ